MSKVRTRFAPSPTGFLHIGSLRTALYSYALAKKNNGDFILRIEDTDQKRKVEGAVESLEQTLNKFNLKWDEFYVQSERQKDCIYQKAAEKLVFEGKAFYCQCKPKNAKEQGFSKVLRDPCRDKNLVSGAIKLKVPENETLTYYDFVHKKDISFQSSEVYDATLLKSDGFPTYHLAVAVDDLDMNITHILRGHDWLPSTPIHILVFKYLGGEMPELGHVTDILSSETGKKLSKRRDSVFVENFLNDGYLEEALLNFVMLLGWAPKDNCELFKLDDFVQNFDIKGFQESNPKFFFNKLDWFNGEYIRKLSVKELINKFDQFSDGFKNLENTKKELITKLVQERIKKLNEIEDLAGFFWNEIELDKNLFGDNYKIHLKKVLEVLSNLDNFELEKLNEELMQIVKDNDFKTGDFFMSLRVAITSKKFTPPINESMIILGKEKTIERINKALLI